MTSAVLLALLRRHCYAAGQGCPDCWPEIGWYCRRIAGLASAFAELRTAEVLSVRAERWAVAPRELASA